MKFRNWPRAARGLSRKRRRRTHRRIQRLLGHCEYMIRECNCCIKANCKIRSWSLFHTSGTTLRAVHFAVITAPRKTKNCSNSIFCRKNISRIGSTLHPGLEPQLSRNWDTNWVQNGIQKNKNNLVIRCYYKKKILISRRVTRATSWKCILTKPGLLSDGARSCCSLIATYWSSPIRLKK